MLSHIRTTITNLGLFFFFFFHKFSKFTGLFAISHPRVEQDGKKVNVAQEHCESLLFSALKAGQRNFAYLLLVSGVLFDIVVNIANVWGLFVMLLLLWVSGII